MSWWLSSLQDPQTKQGKAASTVHGALDEFELCNESFDGSIAFWSGEGRFHSRTISFNALFANWRSSGTELAWAKVSQAGRACTACSRSILTIS